MFSWLYWENQSKVQMYNFLPLRDRNSDDLSINAPSFCFIEQTIQFPISNKPLSIDPQNFESKYERFLTFGAPVPGHSASSRENFNVFLQRFVEIQIDTLAVKWL